MWGLAAVMGALDFLVYVDALQWMSASAATFLLGGPMVLLALGGAIVYGTD